MAIIMKILFILFINKTLKLIEKDLNLENDFK